MEPTTTAALINVGGCLLSNFLGGRDDKKDLAAAKRQAAKDNLLKSLSSRPAQQSQRHQMQDRSRPGILETLAGNEDFQGLLAGQLEKGSELRGLLKKLFPQGMPKPAQTLSLSGVGNTAQGPGGLVA